MFCRITFIHNLSFIIIKHMLDQLIQTAKEQLAPQLEKIGVKQDQLGSVFNVAQESVTDGLKSEVAGGGLDSIFSMFNGQGGTGQSSSIVSSLSNGFVSSLISKLGFDQSMATKISALVIPFIMEKFAGSESGSAASPNDLADKLGFGDISGTLGNLLGGKDKGGDLLGGIGNLF
ncbi:conserved hypothetical protein [Cytophaga hutchinsonii ATCC 33406]|uniref:DUF937 domain-containing protein n=2 Tax=Cytophaga hutchinsonii TaxID=985 RepID=A0A6N4SU05_CYTH3|nr:conserved hypothetical protein [Cytophaga hutchinsonii ATCC 33406]